MTTPSKEMTVAEVLEKWPQTVLVFQELKTACIGCTMAQFDTMIDVAREYNLEVSKIMDALERVVGEA